MQIKVFKASSMKEAVTKMKAELGDDAVILHTKKYKEGGILGYGSKEMVEITAAIEDEKPATPKEEEKPQRPTIAVMPQSILSQYKTNGTAEGVALAEKEIAPSLRTKPTLSDTNTRTDGPDNDSGKEVSTLKRPSLSDDMQSKDQASSLKAAMTPNIRKNQDKNLMPYERNKTSENLGDEDNTSNSQNENISSGVKAEVQPEDKIPSLPYESSETLEDTPNNRENEQADSNAESQESSLNPSDSTKVDLEKSENAVSAPTPYNEASIVPDNSDSQTQSNVTQNVPSIVNSQVPQQNSSQVQSTVSPQQPNNTAQAPLQNQQMSQQSLQPQTQDVNQVAQVQPQSVNAPQPINQMGQPSQVAPSSPENQQIQNVQNLPQQQNISNNPNVQPVSMQPNSYAPLQPMANTSSPDSQANQSAELQNQMQMDMTQPLTPAQLAQAQAMMMAQFNQMQMAQAMQQVMAQAQAQTQAMPQQMYTQPQSQSQPQEQNPSPRSSVENVEIDRKSQEKIKKLEDEIAQMKALLAQVIGKDANRGAVSLHEALRQQEVDEEILSDMAAHANAGETLSDSQSREAKSTLTNFLKENINFSEGIKLNRHGVRIAALLGTTGVGKTTTLAKIAAKFVLEQGITAALITADTYRISAVEQLRTYSDILGLPLEIVYSPDELSKAISKHRNRDLILIDTAGRSQHNDYQMKELQEFLRTNPRIEKHIVLSTTTKSSDANDILDKFSVCEPDKIIFTKTDETAHVGLIVNLLCKKRLSLSYVTNGQSVPDDIIPASADNLAELLLKRHY